MTDSIICPFHSGKLCKEGCPNRQEVARQAEQFVRKGHSSRSIVTEWTGGVSRFAGAFSRIAALLSPERAAQCRNNTLQ